MKRNIRKRRQYAETLETRALLSTITVTSLADNTDADGEVTLREALEAANSDQSVDGSVAGNGADTIVFAEGLAGGTIELDGRQLRITSPVTIDGPEDRISIDADRQSRIFEIGMIENVEISDLRLVRGQAVNGGAIYSEAENLTLVRSRLVKNAASNEGGAVYIVRDDDGSLTIEDSWVNQNNAAVGAAVRIFGSAGGVVVESEISGSAFRKNTGDGIFSSQDAGEKSKRSNAARNGSTFRNSHFLDNRSDESPAMTIRNIVDSEVAGNTGDSIVVGVRLVTGSTFENNEASQFALQMETPLANSREQIGVIENSVFRGNKSFNRIIDSTSCDENDGMVSYRLTNVQIVESTGRLGSGSAGMTDCGGGTTVFEDSLVTEGYVRGTTLHVQNSVFRQEGRSVYALGKTVIVTNSTFEDSGISGADRVEVVNSTIFGRYIYVRSYKGSVSLLHATVLGFNGRRALVQNADEVRNSIVANRPGATGPVVTLTEDAVVSHSLIGSNKETSLASAPPGSPDANGNLIGTETDPIDPMIGALDENGSSTKTAALAPLSPARDAAVADSEVTSDQNGRSRTIGGAPDMGAFEFDPSIRQTPRLTMWSESAGESNEELLVHISLTDVPAGSETVTIEFGTEEDTSEDAATSGADFVATTDTLTFDASSSPTRSVTVPLVDDDFDEPFLETFLAEVQVTAGDVILQDEYVVVEIADNDQSQINQTLVRGGNEQDGEVIVRFELSGAYQEPFTISIDVTPGTADESDFVPPDVDLMFSGEAGEAFDVSIPITDDDDVEHDETISVGFTGAPTSMWYYRELIAEIESDDAGVLFEDRTVSVLGSNETDTVSVTEQTGITTVDINGIVEIFDATTVSQLFIQTIDGADQITVNADIGTTVHAGDGNDRVELAIGTKSASVETGDGNDRIFTAGGRDRIYSGNGHDRIFAGENADRIEAGAGRDTVYGEDGGDTIIGGAGSDSILGGPGNDHLFGDAGGDTIRGGFGWDWIRGSSGGDLLFGDHDRDRIRGSFGNDTIDGGAGPDEIEGDEGEDQITGGTGADEIIDLTGTIHGGSGNDELYGTLVFGEEGDDYLFAGDPDDPVSSVSASLVGGDGHDTLLGNLGSDTLLGGQGNDLLRGDAGDDLLEGQQHRDTLYGESGSDTLSGGDHPDVLIGGGGPDSLDGGRHKDVLFAGAGIDTLSGGGSSDLLNASSFEINAGADGIDLATELLNAWRPPEPYADRIAAITTILDSSDDAAGWNIADTAADIFETDPSVDWLHVDSELDQFTLEDDELFVELEE